MIDPDDADSAPSRNPTDTYAQDEARFNPVGRQVITRGDERAVRIPDASIDDRLHSLWEKWFPGRSYGEPQWSGVSNLTELYASFGIDPSQALTTEMVNSKYREALIEMTECYHAICQRSTEQDADVAAEMSIARVLYRKLDAAKQVLIGTMMLYQADSMHPSDLAQQDDGLWRFRPCDAPESIELKIHQQLEMFVLQDCRIQGYRRYKDSLMERVVENGMPTCAWKAVKTIEAYVYDLPNQKQRLWYDLTSAPGITMFKSIVEYLAHSRDDMLPWLEPDRHVFSFQNGVYLAKDEKFIPYTEMPYIYACSSYPVACKHFQLDFDPEWLGCEDPMQIPTPAIDSVFEYQKLAPDVRRWTFALLGRLFYNVAEFDDWQIFPFIKGMAGTGKSTLLNHVKMVYDEHDVGVVGNMIEKQFGLGQLANRFLGIADDIRENFQMDQSDFQNIASGNAVVCAVKCKDPIVIPRWLVPILFSGNEAPGFHDNSGSFSRRMAIIYFSRFVTKSDGGLGRRLASEIAAFIAKSNRQYRNMIRRYGTTGIWEVLPEEFKTQKAELTAASNALMGFISSDTLVRRGSPELVRMPLGLLRDKVTEYGRANHIPVPKWCKDYYMGPLSALGFQVSDKPRRRIYPSGSGRQVRDLWAEGLDLVENAAPQMQPLAQQKQQMQNPLQQQRPAAPPAAAAAQCTMDDAAPQPSEKRQRTSDSPPSPPQ